TLTCPRSCFEFYNGNEFPTASASGYTRLWRRWMAGCISAALPRVKVETPLPPVFRDEILGKETPPGTYLPSFRVSRFREKEISKQKHSTLEGQGITDFVQLRDKFGRAITDLRIAITDRCNYRCVYCRTGNDGAMYADLPFADYLRMARILVGAGIKKVRITGGEPLLRRGVVEFVRELAELRNLNGGPIDIALTTNGHLLTEMADPLKQAGLRRVTVSMDAVDPGRFARITRVMDGYEAVLAGIRAAKRVGLEPVKV